MDGLYIFIVFAVIVVIALIIVQFWGKNYSLNAIKAKPVGDGQHGTAKWADEKEKRQNLKLLKYEPDFWRMKACLPTLEGTIVGCENHGKDLYALIDTDDVHTLMIAAAGAGKTAYFLYANIEYCCAAGMSFISTDTKGDIYRNCAYIAAERYGYNISVIDLRNPSHSDSFNLLSLVKKYMKLHKENDGDVIFRAKAEKYAKITADSIITVDGEKSYGANTYFYDSAKGLLAALILVLAEFGEAEECHIVSVLKLMIELLQQKDPAKKSQFKQNEKTETYFAELMKHLPPEHKAKWLSGAALNSAEQTILSVISTALSRLNAFIDSEMEQILCFDSAIDSETFCKEKSAVFIVLPEEDKTKYVVANLIIQQLSREIYAIADENGGRLPKRVMMYLDEFGTLPPISGVESLFSAARSRNVSIVAIIQSFAQLQKNYGKEGTEIIADNTQLTLFGGFSPNSSSAETLSKALGNRTVLSGSVSKNKGENNRQSQQLQMISRPLMTTDELKKLPMGCFICMKTGMNPFMIKLKLYIEWGIRYDEHYRLSMKEVKKVSYTERDKLIKTVKSAFNRINIRPLNIFDYSLDDDDTFEEKAETLNIRT